MARYIDIDDTVKTFEKLHGEESTLLNCYNADWIFSFLESQPTADVALVVHGRWIDKGEYAVCMECGGRSSTQYNGVEPIPLMTQFCPHCGAKMNGGEQE